MLRLFRKRPLKGYSFIWDLDGTLLDSYASIVAVLKEVADRTGVTADPEEIHRDVITYSVGHYVDFLSEKTGRDTGELSKMYRQIEADGIGQIGLIRNAKETLEKLADMGAVNFVYTHRGRTTHPILVRLGVEDCFKEIVTSVNGFARKPAPDGIDYLVNKYHLDKCKCFYVGDRSLDVYSGKNAGVRTILYLEKGGIGQRTGDEDHVVSDLLEIPDIR